MQATVSSHQFANGRAHTLTRKKKKEERVQDQCAMNPSTKRQEKMKFAGSGMSIGS